MENGLIEYAAKLDVNLLYCLSGIETEEPVLQPTRIDYYLGKGQTAQVLRNLCLQVYQKSESDWKEIKELMNRLFQVKLFEPVENSKGVIELFYLQKNSKEPFELASAGRGFQQMLLIFAYLYSHKKSILLIDEPDAHLEILRQKQVYVLLRDIADKNQSQIIMVTHSEVVCEEALERNLTLLLNGSTENMAKKPNIKASLSVYGAEHYIRAKERGYILYTEGSTDIDILFAFEKKLNHDVINYWDDRINSYYVQNIHSQPNLQGELEKVEGGFGLNPKEHFNILRKLIPDLKGLAILDNDGKNLEDYDDGYLKIVYWKKYEIENYFITPDLLIRYIEDKIDELGLFAPSEEKVHEILFSLVKEKIFENNQRDYETWKKSPKDAALLIWDTKTTNVKLSEFAEEFFERIAKEGGSSVLLRKGEFYKLVNLVEIDTISTEVKEKLDYLKELFLYGKEIQNRL